MVDRRPKNKRSRERERERETKGVAFVSLYFARILWMRDCLSREEEEEDEEGDENRDFSFAEKEKKMGNSIAMAEQVLEQEEPVQETSKEEEEEGEAVEEKVKDGDEDGNAGEDEARDENAVADGEAEEASSEEEVEEEKPKITVDDVKTAPMDYRFPTTNQAKHCYTRYNEFHKCAAEKGEDAKECKKYAKYYRSLCPGDWIDKWNEERENGTFPGRY